MTCHNTRAIQFNSVHQLLFEWLLDAIYHVDRHGLLRNWTRWWIIIFADLPASIFSISITLLPTQEFWLSKVEVSYHTRSFEVGSWHSVHLSTHSIPQPFWRECCVCIYMCISWAYYILAYLHGMLFLFQEYPSSLKKVSLTFKPQHFVTSCSWPSPLLPPWFFHAPFTPCENLH